MYCKWHWDYIWLDLMFWEMGWLAWTLYFLHPAFFLSNKPTCAISEMLFYLVGHSFFFNDANSNYVSPWQRELVEFISDILETDFPQQHVQCTVNWQLEAIHYKCVLGLTANYCEFMMFAIWDAFDCFLYVIGIANNLL